jgi:hypothetical protein
VIKLNKQAAKKELEAIKNKNDYKAISKERWTQIARQETLTENFIECYQDKLPAEALSFHQDLSVEFILSGKYPFTANELKYNKHLTIEKFEQLTEIMPFDYYISNPNATSDFLLQHKSKINKTNVSNIDYKILNEDALIEFFPLIEKTVYFYSSPKFTLKVLETLESEINWETLSRSSKVSDEALLAFDHKIDWEDYESYNNNPLPEFKLIELLEAETLLNIQYHIGRNTNLSEDFIRTYIQHFSSYEIVKQVNAPADLLIKVDLKPHQLRDLFNKRLFKWEDAKALIKNCTDRGVINDVFATQSFDIEFYSEQTKKAYKNTRLSTAYIHSFIKDNPNITSKTRKMIELKTMFNKI